jgi:hypothetical protein
MTNAIETAQQAVLVVQSALPVLAKLLRLTRTAKQSLLAPALSYENELLDVTLDLQNRHGSRATVMCRQRVRFLVKDARVVASPIWGEGDQLAGYEANGASRLGEQNDGSKRVQLLAIRDSHGRNHRATFVVNRQVHNGFTSPNEYFESAVQRPTKRLRLTVLFPKSRPPTETYLVSSTNEATPRPRLRLRDGRPRLTWCFQSPKPDAIYSLRWSW